MDGRKIADKNKRKETQIWHILKNGTTSTDITGHMVKRADCPQIYKVLERIRHESIVNRPADSTNKTMRGMDGSTKV